MPHYCLMITYEDTLSCGSARNYIKKKKHRVNMVTSHEPLDEYWKQRAQDEVLEDPAKVEDNIRALRTLVQGEKGLYSRTDDIFLLAFLRARKHNVNEAFRLVKNFYKIKKAHPKALQCCLPSEKGHIYDMDVMTVLDQKDNDGRIVVIMRFEKVDFKKTVIEECFQMTATVLSFCCEDPHVQISGVVFIVDMTGYGLQHFLVATPSNISLFVKMFQDSFPLRLKGIHVVNAPSLFGAVFALCKPFLKENLRRRIHVHGRSMSSLHEYVPYEILPKQLGGMIPDFNFSSFRHKIQQNENMIKEWNKYGYGMKPQDSSGISK